MGVRPKTIESVIGWEPPANVIQGVTCLNDIFDTMRAKIAAALRRNRPAVPHLAPSRSVREMATNTAPYHHASPGVYFARSRSVPSSQGVCMFPRLLACAIITISPSALAGDAPNALLTVAERSGFKATARHAEVVALLDRIAAASPLVNRTSLGRSGEGREIPAVLIADPPLTTPAEAAKQIREHNKLAVMAIGNIHGGEVCGKEALVMFARELAMTESHPLLNDLIIILAPIYNTDGNEQFGKDNRRGQNGPEEGMGRRPNAAGLDLNRDFIKLEAPETQALVRFINAWDPSVFIDTHTTNGSYHRYIITYEGPKTPAGNERLIEFTRDTMFPAITRLSNEKYGVPTYFYGNFNREHTRWTTYEAAARYGTSYIGLRNRISILSEAYSYATYEQRVLGTRDFIKACFEYAAAHKARIRKLLAGIDSETSAAGRNPRDDDMVTLRSRIAVGPVKVSVAGEVEKTAAKLTDVDPNPHRRRRTVSTGIPKDYEVELWNRFEAVHAVCRPYAYLIPGEQTTVIETLRRHGVRFEELEDETQMSVEVYRVDTIAYAEREFQKHRVATVEATPRAETRRMPAGTIVVRTGQPLGNLIVYLLEPECEDGLTTWNFFDGHLEIGKDFPILRVPEPVEPP